MVRGGAASMIAVRDSRINSSNRGKAINGRKRSFRIGRLPSAVGLGITGRGGAASARIPSFTNCSTSDSEDTLCRPGGTELNQKSTAEATSFKDFNCESSLTALSTRNSGLDVERSNTASSQIRRSNIGKLGSRLPART